MSIQIVEDKGVWAPAFYCDACGEPIREWRTAAAVFEMHTTVPPTKRIVLHVHKGICHKKAERGMIFAGWVELSAHIVYLVNNSGMSLKELKEKRTAMLETGI